jgi:putative redox protein
MTAPTAGDPRRSVRLERTEVGRYRAVNVRGGEITMATGGEGDTDFTPVELLLAAIAGCSAVDVDTVTSRRSEPTEFVVESTGNKVRDDLGNHVTDLQLTFRLRFPDNDGGSEARDIAPRAIQQSHDRLCSVSRTVEIGTPVEIVADIEVV